ncbi:Calmodulin-lysine N-methyltransferase [Toxocara canis]|uniref:Calmodulin-lysine N-methyltransferase n=1 Tax=Toxocara canis TaxID=6265 RepID=A0A0B2VX71_TOXCA|nr:Calmodulin-lysine N-methyltransferase [Toxocara canis]
MVKANESYSRRVWIESSNYETLSIEVGNLLSGRSFKLSFRKKHSEMQDDAVLNPQEEQPTPTDGEEQPENDDKKELCAPPANSLAVTPPSSARRRWMLLSNKIVTKARKAQEQPQEREDPDGFKSFGFFALAAFGERSPTGCWYQLISPTKDVRLQLHFLADKRIALKDLVGYDNTGNVRLWPSEECLAEYLLLNEEICRDKRVLELGAGMTGLAGLMALTAGAKTIYLTDGNERSVENLQMIVEKNSLNLGVKCAILEWAGERLSEKFDLVICADCLFFTNSHEALLGCIHAHLVDGGTAYLMAPSRRGTAMQFLNQIYEERERWKSVQVVFHFQREIERRIKLFEGQDIYEPDVHTPILFILQK